MESILNIELTKQHPLLEEIRTQIVSNLYTLVATYIDANGRIWEAHWNSKGSNFNSIHTLLDDLLSTSNSSIDRLSERIRVLGAMAKANLDFAKSNTVLTGVKDIDYSIDNNIKIILEILNQIITLIYIQINIIDPLDKITSTILQEQCEAFEKYIYLLENNFS